MPERAIRFDADGNSLRGMLHEPPAGTPHGPAIVFLHGWAGSRVGPHRMFVHAARTWSAAGCLCLRFDFAGRGDSEGEALAATIERMTADTQAAIEFTRRHAPHRPLLLVGICSGAKVAIAAAAGAPCVRGLLLWSAEPMGDLRTPETARNKTRDALRRYARKLLSPATWRKLLTGRVNPSLVRRALVDHDAPTPAETAREAHILRTFRSFRGPVFFLYGSADPTTRPASDAYNAYCAEAGLAAVFDEIPNANHNFSGLDWERDALARSTAWLHKHFPFRP